MSSHGSPPCRFPDVACCGCSCNPHYSLFDRGCCSLHHSFRCGWSGGKYCGYSHILDFSGAYYNQESNSLKDSFLYKHCFDIFYDFGSEGCGIFSRPTRFWHGRRSDLTAPGQPQKSGSGGVWHRHVGRVAADEVRICPAVNVSPWDSDIKSVRHGRCSADILCHRSRRNRNKFAQDSPDRRFQRLPPEPC